MIVIMGVTGCGKTTVGRAFASSYGWVFQDADDLHSAASIAKMRAGMPLTDIDRAPWLAAVRHSVVGFHGPQGPAVIACSALKEAYRQVVLADDQDTALVYLRGSEELIFGRLEGRAGHFMPRELLRSQFQDLQEPTDAIVIDINQRITEMVAQIAAATRQTSNVEGAT